MTSAAAAASNGSRLIVKNLPKRTTEEKLRSLFLSKGAVTDVSLKYSQTDNAFRGFAFVGFKSPAEANSARDFFDGTFVGANKIRVELCADIGDANKPKPWSKHSVGKSESPLKKPEEKEGKAKKETSKKKEKKKAADEILDKYQDDPKFQEFLRLHKKGTDESAWNDAPTTKGKKEAAKDISAEDADDDAAETEAKDSAQVSDLDYLKTKVVSEAKVLSKKKKKKDVEFFTVKISGLPCKSKKKDVKAFFKPLKPKSIRVPTKIKGIAYVGFATEDEMKKSLSKQKSFLNGHQIFIRPFNSLKSDSKHVDHKNAKWREQEESVVKGETVAESGRLFVRNLSYTVTESDLEQLFKKYGPLSELNMPVDKLSGKVKGFAFVTYMIPEHAVKAFSDLDGSSFQGRLLHLIPGKPKFNPADELDTAGMSFKQKKALKQKSEAESSHNWNSLFLGASAVADLMAERYGVSKSDVLASGEKKHGKDQQSAAVRLALGETQIVSETRAFLEAEGIALEAFSTTATTERSKTVILAKNLPPQTAVESIRDVFVKYGSLGRVVLPPSGVTAVIEFLDAVEAKKAFRGLAYSKFGHVPLYLEWAPERAFKEPFEKTSEETKSGPGLVEPHAAESPLADDEEPEPNAMLFVKNLNFSTNEDALREHFSEAGSIHSVSVARKKDMKHPGQLLSMGYGFVQFRRAADAERALKNLQHKVLDEHCLELKRSSRAAQAQSEVRTARKRSLATDQASEKILVRNVPFEANAREVEDLFRAFGELKSVRLPRKMGSSWSGAGGASAAPHRGFAFVEFSTKAEAKRAFDTLCHSTHLYGRRLVLEWAEADANSTEDVVNDLRRKTAARFTQSAAPGATRTKKQKLADIEEAVATASSNRKR